MRSEGSAASSERPEVVGLVSALGGERSVASCHEHVWRGRGHSHVRQGREMGTYGCAGATGIYCRAAATGRYGGAGATGTYGGAGATGAYGGAGATGTHGWVIRGECIGTRDKKERMDFSRGVALEGSCFLFIYLHKHNCTLVKHLLGVSINNNTKHVIIQTGAACNTWCRITG